MEETMQERRRGWCLIGSDPEMQEVASGQYWVGGSSKFSLEIPCFPIYQVERIAIGVLGRTRSVAVGNIFWHFSLFTSPSGSPSALGGPFNIIQLLENAIPPHSCSARHKNPGHLPSYCMYPIWSTGFLQSFWQYFWPPDFDTSWTFLDSWWMACVGYTA